MKAESSLLKNSLLLAVSGLFVLFRPSGGWVRPTHIMEGSRLTEIHQFRWIKRCLLLGRKVMTNLDSIFKSRDITLPTKVRLVKAMVFPVVMYGCESRTVKKAEHRRIDALELWCWSAGSQREESHPRQGHAERPDGQGESGLRVSPWNFLSMYPQNQNLPALLYCAFPFF